MRTVILAMLVFCLGASRAVMAVDLPAADPDVPDLDGAWLVESTPRLQSGLNLSTLTISGDEFTFHGFQNLNLDWTGFITLATDGNPNHFELKTDEFSLGNGSSWVYPATKDLPGIFELKGNRLRISFANTDHGHRPDDFAENPANTVATLVRADPNFNGFPDSVVVTVLDPSGKPVAGATLFSGITNEWPRIKSNDGRLHFDLTKPLVLRFDDRGLTGTEGTIRLKYRDFCGQAIPIGARLADHRWIGLTNVSPATLCRGTLIIQMQPQRMLRGTVQREIKFGDNWGAVHLTAFGYPCGFCIADGDAFSLPVPPGSYSLRCYGADVLPKTIQITVPAGDGDFVIPPVALAARGLGSLVGKPFPPIGKHAAAWKNGPIANLADLTGKLVLIYFWNSQDRSCAAQLQTLMHLQEKYANKGLAVIGVHCDEGAGIDTVAKLDEADKKYLDGIWDHDLQFPVALCDEKFEVAQAAFGVFPLPCSVILDRRGVVLGFSSINSGNPAADFNAALSDETKADAAIEKLLAIPPGRQQP